MLVGFAGLRNDQRRFLLPFLLTLIVASALLGIVQITGGSRSPAYLFANRNHQATFLAIGFPIIRVWSLLPGKSLNEERFRTAAAVVLAVFLMVMILVVGSRTGMGLALLGLMSAALVVRPKRADGASRQKRRWIVPLTVAATVAIFAIVFLFGRAEAINRLMTGEMGEDQRIQSLPVVLRMISDFLPWGSGFGSFDPVYRSYEPDDMLSIYYLNHAHNDLTELTLTGGLPALAVLATFLVWAGSLAFAAFRPWSVATRDLLYARVGAITIAVFLLASLVDYPLRTPLASIVFTLACAWLGAMDLRRAQTGAKD
jgi:O-antigen ligase